MSKEAIIVGAGLGGLCTALRLSTRGYKVKVIEKNDKPGGRLHQLKKEGFTFDMGPSFFSMSYEFEEFFSDCGVKNPLQFNELDPLYAVYFADKKDPYYIYKDLKQLAEQFKKVEPDLERKAAEYLRQAGNIFHDTENIIVKKNYDSKLSYLVALMTVPLKHAPKLFRTMWQELSRHFESEEVRIIFSLVSFFLGSTPFETPSVYSLLNYTEMVHDGYWNVKGGMYKIAEEIELLCVKNGVKFEYDTEISGYKDDNGKIASLIDNKGNYWEADLYIINGDAAAVRGKIFNRKKYSEKKLDKMEWTLSPFTIYLGINGKIDDVHHHNYFLGNNFKEYADTIFKTSVAPDKPYYYVNVSSKSNPDCAPEGCENIFILCPVPDLRFKPNWTDREKLAENIIEDLGQRVNYDIKSNIITQTIMDPIDWQDKFNLYRGSGLGLAHGLNQVGGLRPSNKDEEFNNVYYVGASTVPGTGLPIVVISSKLATQRIENEFPIISKNKLSV